MEDQGTSSVKATRPGPHGGKRLCPKPILSQAFLLEYLLTVHEGLTRRLHERVVQGGQRLDKPKPCAIHRINCI